MKRVGSRANKYWQNSEADKCFGVYIVINPRNYRAVIGIHLYRDREAELIGFNFETSSE
jgi:hypothetical protein